jgi:hypothetical protein
MASVSIRAIPVRQSRIHKQLTYKLFLTGQPWVRRGDDGVGNQAGMRTFIEVIPWIRLE